MKPLNVILAALLLAQPALAANDGLVSPTASDSPDEISSGPKQEALQTGVAAGKQLGDSAFLLRLVTTPHGPLRIALVAAALNQSGLSQALINQTFERLSKELPDWSWQQAELPEPEPTTIPSSQSQAQPSGSPVPSPSPTPLPKPSASPAPAAKPTGTGSTAPDLLKIIPYNQRVMDLADAQGLDMVLNVRIEPVKKGFWVLTSLYSGADGSLLRNFKHTISTLEAQALSQALLEDLKALKSLPPVKDLSAAGGGELHLRSTPEGLHAYLDDAPIGLTPLILRQVPPGPHQLRLFEADPYLIERIRIISDPPGIMVKVNDRQLGRTPLDFPSELMVPGRYEIDLSTESRDRFEAQIQVQTKPDNIPVQLNQLPIKRTPVTFQELAQNHYTLLLAPNRAVDLLLPLNLPPGQIQKSQIDAYKYAKLKINSNISKAQVSIDKEVVGETPYSVTLSQGQHTIELAKNRFRTQNQTVVLAGGETRDLSFELKPRSTDTSIFLTPTGELTPQFNIGAKYLTFGNLTRNSQSELAHLYGIEADYGWPELYHFLNTFDIGLEVSGFLFALQSPSLFRSFQGVGAKLQLLRESDSMPISAAIGGYANIDFSHPKIVGYLSLSRNFGDFALHLGIQTHGFNLNLGYTGWENIRLGLMLYSDAFLRLLSVDDERFSTFYGLEAGYSF